MLGPSITLLILVAMLVALGAFITKAGFSKWWVLLVILPPINIILFIVFALRRWPIQEELIQLRVMANSAKKEDFEALHSMAVSADKQGDWDRAMLLFGLIATHCKEEEMRSYAQMSIAQLRRNEPASSDPSNPYSSPQNR